MAKIKVDICGRRDFFADMGRRFEGTDIGAVCEALAGSLEILRVERRKEGCDSFDCPGEENSRIAAIQASVRLMLKGQQVFSVEHMALSGYMAWCETMLPDKKP